MANDALGDRMKRYEAASRFFLPPKQAVMIRVDGRAFHTYTKGMNKPFDHDLMEAMVHATTETAKDLAGFKLAYTQSDEASFLITDFDDFATQGWFDYNLSKVISLSAATFTAHFNAASFDRAIGHRLATFDSRAFTVPMDDVPNAFLWRQKDWYRNSVQMLGQAHFSHKQLNGKKLADIHDMLMDGPGINWAKLSPAEKNGTFIRKTTVQYEHVDVPCEHHSQQQYHRTEFEQISEKVDYTTIQNWICPPVEEKVDA